MSILTRINGAPVYTSINEALEWGEYNGAQGYHVHKHMSVTGYMGGKTHSLIPLKTRDLPIKIKTKSGYSPIIGSTVINIANGKRSSTRVDADMVFDRTGAPLLLRDKDVVESIINDTIIPQAPIANQPLGIVTPQPLGIVAPQPNVVVQSSSGGGGGGYSGGGGY